MKPSKIEMLCNRISIHSFIKNASFQSFHVNRVCQLLKVSTGCRKTEERLEEH